ncbi:MAG: hypothetical protein H0X50_10270 [Nitrosopumilus sp.]|nr:hypothetical protein [Nitrosopumilus sp.]
MLKKVLLLSIPLIMATSLVFASVNLNVIYGQQNQTSPQSDNQTSNLKIENLLKFSNNAVIALGDDNDTAVAQYIEQFQNSIIDTTGKQVIRVPADAEVSE